jgi:hypothetical protein
MHASHDCASATKPLQDFDDLKRKIGREGFQSGCMLAM